MKKKVTELNARQKRILALEAKLEEGLTPDEMQEYDRLVRLEISIADSDVKNRDTKSTGRTKRIVGWIGALTGIAVPAGSWLLFNNYVDKGFEFEKEGTYTSSTFKDIIRRIQLPKWGGGSGT